MSTYTKELSDVPDIVTIRPLYDANGATVAVAAEFSWISRIKNDADATDIIVRGAATKTVDLFSNSKTVNIPGVGVVSYRKLAIGLGLVAAAER